MINMCDYIVIETLIAIDYMDDLEKDTRKWLASDS